MIRVFSLQKKGAYEIIAVADAQGDLNNLRLMSYSLYNGKDKVQLNKEEYGGPYLKVSCDEFMDGEGHFDVAAVEGRVKELQSQYS